MKRSAVDPAGDARLSSLRDAIAAWFARGHRDLPWRRTRDPYAVWVSEIMLQQTRVDTVAPRFERWMARFPTVAALAAAPLDDVLSEWAGLGYYARARNLHAAARVVATEHGGRVPDTSDAISRLPGVGRYTTGAILSIAYDQPVALLDGNVERVLCRLFRVGGDPKSAETRTRLWALAERIAAVPRPGVAAMQKENAAPHNERPSPSRVNQGLMELGAVVCTPRRPACLACPVHAHCEARRAGVAECYPEKGRVQQISAIDHVAVALVRDGKLLLARRPPAGLWGGLFELVSGEPLVGETIVGAARRIAAERAGLSIDTGAFAPLPAPADRFEHLLSHRRITFHGVRAQAPRGRVRRTFYDAHRWVAPSRVAGLGISRATARLVAALLDGDRRPKRNGHG